MSQDAEPKKEQVTTDIAQVSPDAEVALPDPLEPYGLSIPAGAPVIPAKRTLEFGGPVAFKLQVPYINRAEAFYHEFFEMDIAFRAWDRNGIWEATTEPIDWPSLMIWGEYPELTFLQRPEWSIVIVSIGRGQVLTSPKLGDAEVPVSLRTLRTLRARALMKNYTVVEDSADAFAFRDPFAVVWRLVADDSLSAVS